MNGAAQIRGIFRSLGLILQHTVDFHGGVADLYILDPQIVHQCAVACNAESPDGGAVRIGQILHSVIVIHGLIVLSRHQRPQEVDLVIQPLAGHKTLDAVIDAGVVGQAGELHVCGLHTGGGNELAPFCAFGIIRIGKQGIVLVVGKGKATEHILGHGEIHLGRAGAAVGPDSGGTIHPVIVEVIPNAIQQFLLLGGVDAGIESLVNGIVDGVGLFLRRQTHRTRTTWPPRSSRSPRPGTVGRTGGALRVGGKDIGIHLFHIGLVGPHGVALHNDRAYHMNALIGISGFKVMFSSTGGHICGKARIRFQKVLQGYRTHAVGDRAAVSLNGKQMVLVPTGSGEDAEIIRHSLPSFFDFACRRSNRRAENLGGIGIFIPCSGHKRTAQPQCTSQCSFP